MQKVKLNINDKEIFLPIIEGNDGRNSLDLTSLHEQTGLYGYDYRLHNTAIAQSNITYIDKENGKLYYRGYDLETLVEHSRFVEVSYLLIHGELPTTTQYKKYSNSLSKHSMIHEAMRNFFSGFPVGSNPLAILATMVTALSSYYPLSYEEHFSEGIDIKTRLLSKVRTLAAWAYKKSIGHPTIYPRDEYPYCTNFLNMMFALPTSKYVVKPIQAKMLNQVLILYGDHEMSVATTTVRLVASSGANLFVCINAGISALWGSREAINQLNTLQILEEMVTKNMKAEDFFKDYVSGKKDLNSNTFGHKKYNGMEARARVAKKILHKYLIDYKDDLATQNQLTSNYIPLSKILSKAIELEDYVENNTYFNQRNLYPNLDFYSSLLLSIIGIPETMFNVVRVIGKLGGWLAHWEEEYRANKNTKTFIRPQQVYTGNKIREFVAIDKRV